MSIVFPSITVDEDALGGGIYTGKPVRCASVVPAVLENTFPGDIIDGTVTEKDDRVLFKDQTSQIENGVYRITVEGPIRDSDYTDETNVEYTQLFVQSGTQHEYTTWMCLGGSRIVGTDELEYTKIGSSLTLKNATRIVVDTKASTTREDYDVVPDLSSISKSSGSSIIYYSLALWADRNVNADVVLSLNGNPITQTEQSFRMRGAEEVAYGFWIEFEVNIGDKIELLWRVSKNTIIAGRRVLFIQEF
tara:strand:- start:37336 stop:38079 length:744 start_codon:yes stop_codon:yes gene_type:complete